MYNDNETVSKAKRVGKSQIFKKVKDPKRIDTKKIVMNFWTWIFFKIIV